MPAAANYIVSELVQKITQIAPACYVGCSGDGGKAKRYIDFLRSAISRGPVTAEIILKAQLDYFKHHEDDIYLFSSIILFQDEIEIYAMPVGHMIEIQNSELGHLYVMGTGAEAFLGYLDRFSLNEVTRKTDLPLNLKLVSYMLECTTTFIHSQHGTGLGVAEGWGGAFELVICEEQGILKKLDNVMFLYVGWEEQKGNIRIHWIGKRFFQYYEGDTLIIFSQLGSEPASVHSVFPPDANAKSGKTFPLNHAPQMVCVLFFNKQTGSVFTELSYNNAGHSYCGLSHSEERGYAIRCNTEVLKSIIRSRFAT